MVFSSIAFLVYFLPFFLLVYFIADKKYKNGILLVSSIFFYAWGAPNFIFVVLGTTALDFYLVRFLYQSVGEKKSKLFLILSLSLNLGLLFYFKYCNFFIDNFNQLMRLAGIEHEISWAKIILPIGISFYTFESLTYVVDVYRRVHKPLNNFWEYQMYILLFPKLIAGPIVRYHDIADQISDRSANDTIDNKLMGFYRFCIGLGKKVLIANVMAVKADEVFNSAPQNIGQAAAWIGSLAYTFQIYFDFSGYSDMAIGIGNMLGFKFPENFNNPYTAGSITEFWRRWHMTLGNWMKNYLYIPLGGNKVSSKSKLYFNLWLVFLASGFWHGAAWTFVIWGIYHGVFLIIERSFLLKLYTKLGKFIPILITFFIVNIGWIYFRADSFYKATHIIAQLFNFSSGQPLYLNNEFAFCFILAILFSFFTVFAPGKKIQNLVYYNVSGLPVNALFTFFALVLFILSLSNITTSGFNPFIYFRF